MEGIVDKVRLVFSLEGKVSEETLIIETVKKQLDVTAVEYGSTPMTQFSTNAVFLGKSVNPKFLYIEFNSSMNVAGTGNDILLNGVLAPGGRWHLGIGPNLLCLNTVVGGTRVSSFYVSNWVSNARLNWMAAK